MRLTTQYPTNPVPDQRRKYYPLLAVLALALATLACINSELTLTVNHQKDAVDTLDVLYEQYLVPSYVDAAKAANQERADDFSAAGRDPGEPFLPTTREELKEAFDIKKYKDMGYDTQVTETGFSATKNISLKQDKITEEWKVRIINDPDQPEQTIYRVKVYMDYTDMDLGDLVKLRNTPLMDKPDPNATGGGGSSGSSGFLGDLTAVAASIAEVAEAEMGVELYYVQKALQNSEPMHHSVTVTLPGTILIHTLNGTKSGTLEGNTVTLLLDEAALASYAGKDLVFHVESVVKDCSKACDTAPHLIWDGKEGVSCNCICEKGFEVIEGEQACVNCDSVCSWSDPNLVTDLENCEDNQCACWCKEGMVMNKAGTACIDEYDAWVEDLQRSEQGGPSAQALADLFAAFVDPENDKNINQMPGWFLLTSGERENFLSFLEALGLAVDRTQLIVDLGPDMTTDQRAQQIKEEQDRLTKIRELAINQLQDEIDERRRIQKYIIKEIGGKHDVGQYLVKIPEWYSKIHQSSYELAKGYVEGKLTDAVKKRILQETHGKSPANYPAAAAELIKQIPQMATNSCVDDYYLYLDLFKANCGSNCQGDNASLAHEMALEELQKKIGPGRINWSKPGDAYDNAFRKLNPDVP